MIDELFALTQQDNRKFSALPKNTVVAMAYVPFQLDDKLYTNEQGFVSGTMFPVLNKPFKGYGDKK